MKILFLTDNFRPERNAPATRTYEHAVEWVRAGHSVTVITTVPNFPEGRVFPGYRNAWRTEEMVDGVRVVRVKSFIAANERVVKRALDYASFMLTGALAALREPRPDVLVTTSPQFFCAIAGWIVSRLRRVPWVFELRDLWPASIVAVGALKQGVLVRMLERLELRMYHAADAIVSVTHSFKRELVWRGVKAGKIEVVLNGVKMSMYSPRPKDTMFLDKYALRGRFVVGYLGTHGLAHALDKVADAATLLRDRHDIVFLFAGAGAKRTELERTVAQRGLKNVRLIPPQPKEQMPQLWSVHDLALVPLLDQAVFSTVIPSKIFEAMGMGVPILISVPPGEATALVEDIGCGEVVAAEDPRAIANAIVRLAHDRDRLAAMSDAGLAAAARFSRAEQARRMLDLLTCVAEGRSAVSEDATPRLS